MKGTQMTDTDKWEYLVESYGGGIRSAKAEEIQAGLNNLGEQGWEVIAVHQLNSNNKILAVAKRPLTDSVQKRRIREKRGW